MATQIKKYTDILADLTAKSANLKQAAVKKADGVPSVPEKDPEDKGTVAIPKDPNAAAAVQNLPENKTNADETPTATVPPAKVIAEPEKGTGLTAKAAALLATVKSLRKSAGTASQISTNGSLPNDAGNDNKSKQPLDTPKPAPAAGKADPAVKESAKEVPETDKTKKKAPMPAGDSKGELPKETKNTDETSKEAATEADPDLSNIDQTFFSKLAQTCLQFEEGRNVMEACLKKAHGAEHAQNLIKTAMFMEYKMQELAQLESAGASAAEEFWKSASDEDRAGLLKLASMHETALVSFPTELECEAYLEGAKIAADMADAGMTGEQPPPGVPGMGGEGDPAAAQGAEGGEVSDEDIIQALQMLVQQGKITEEEAEAILQQLLGGAGGAGGAPEDAEAGADGPPQPEPSPEQKEAAEKLKTVGQAVDAVFAALTPAAKA